MNLLKWLFQDNYPEEYQPVVQFQLPEAKGYQYEPRVVRKIRREDMPELLKEQAQ